ncbi:acyltransferase [Gelidibacter japonicus]|uniref:acyltransferase n=1 Tax=Gelidibacter japonicus TaxID=1962232 RepID=UPI00201FD773|nr:acyltransferase [Gelidibacter japonicus]MCL8006648.1 acyltransferase [Gelidibacter japonicus]
MKNTIKDILKFFLPYYSLFLRYLKTKVGNTSYLRYLKFKLFGNKVYWYYHKNCTIAHPRKIYVGKNCLIGRPGCYIQGAGTVYIGDYVQFGPNVGVLSTNHDLYDQTKYRNASIKIGDYSWVGMNSVVTAGVELGTRTIVAAGSVVTKSFPKGFCVIGGTPAKLIKQLDENKFTPWREEEEWYGYLTQEEFEKNKNKYLDVFP